MTDEAANTDRELWREREGDYYADSIHVTQDGGIGMNVGGRVIVMPIFEWHALATGATKIQPLMGVQRPEDVERAIHEAEYGADTWGAAGPIAREQARIRAAAALLALPHAGQPQEGRCAICDWPLAASADQGCVPGNCSYRPEQGSAEYRRIQERRATLSAAPASPRAEGE